MDNEPILVNCPRCGRVLGFERGLIGVSLLDSNGFLIKNLTAVCPCGELIHWSMSDKVLVKAAESLRVPDARVHIFIHHDGRQDMVVE